MKYSTKTLARMYQEYLTNNEFEVDIDVSQPFNIDTYNEYTYLKLMRQYEQMYEHTDTLSLTEQFLKGD